MSSLIRLATPLVVIAAGVGAYALLIASKPEPEKKQEAPRPISVYTATVKQEPVNLQVVTQGEVRARTEVDIISQVGGKIVSVSREFTEGGQVQPGVPLLAIEDRDYRLARSQAEARLAEARVRVKQALADADVARKQLRNDPTASDLALKKPQVAEAQARLKAAQADLEQTSLNLERTQVTLPFRGRLTATAVDIGQYLTPGTPIGKAFGTDVVEVRLPLDDSQLAGLGLPIGYSAGEEEGLPVTFSARVAGSRHQWQGRLVRLDASIDPMSRMLYGIAETIDPYGEGASATGMPLAVGLFVEARIHGGELEDANTIPRNALRAGGQVFIVNDQSQLEIRRVVVAHSTEEQVVIREGLSAGERVITSPVRNPIAGMHLQAIDGQATSVAAPQPAGQ